MAILQTVVTPRQNQALSVIHSYIQSSGFPPSLVELKQELGISSNQSVLDLLHALEEKRCIRRHEGSARAIRILSQGFHVLGVKPLVPVVGETAAGPFLEAIEHAGTWHEVGEDIDRLEQVIFVRVKGDSMIGAGIEDGDMVLVRESIEFSSGKVVLAETPYGTTLKRFILQNKSPYKYLKPENPKHDILIFTKNIHMRGIAFKVFKQDGRALDVK